MLILSWMYRGLMPCIPSRGASSFSSLMLSSVNPGMLLPLYSLSFCSLVMPAFLGSASRVSTAHIAATSTVWGAMCMPLIRSAPKSLL